MLISKEKINQSIPIVFLVLLSLLPLFALFHPGLPRTHDGQDHVARIANFYLSLTEGNIVPRWAPLLNWGYGHPVLMFLYPLPSYLASLFHFMGFSLVDSLKIVFGLSFVASGLTMYFFASSLFGRLAGFAAGMLYVYAPYRFVDLYVRGAIGEHVAFVFPPLVLFFMNRITKQSSPWNVVLGGLSFAGLLVSHNAVSLMFLPVFFMFWVYLLWQQNKKRFFVTQTLLLFFTGILVSSFFVMPGFLEGKYTLRDIVTEGEYLSRFETLERFFFSSWSFNGTGEFSVQFGPIQWILILVQPFIIYLFYKNRQKKYVYFGTGLLVLLAGTTFIMLEQAKPVYSVFTILQKFQFPWRFLTLIVFLTSLMGALTVYAFKERYRLVFVVLLTLLLVVLNSGYWRAKEYITYPESFYKSIYNSTTDTGESAPIWSVRFMQERPKKNSEVIDGDAVILGTLRDSTTRRYQIVAKEDSRIRENTLYFPGWTVSVNGAVVPIEFQDPNNRGLITYNVLKGENDVEISFLNTRLRSIAEFITLSGLIIMIVYLVFFSKFKKWKVFQ